MKLKNLKKFLASSTLGATFIGMISCTPTEAITPSLLFATGMVVHCISGYMMINIIRSNNYVNVMWDPEEVKQSISDYCNWLEENNIDCDYTPCDNENMDDFLCFVYALVRANRHNPYKQLNRAELIGAILDYCLYCAECRMLMNKNNFISDRKKFLLSGENNLSLFDISAKDLPHFLSGQTDDQLRKLLQNISQIQVFCEYIKSIERVAGIQNDLQEIQTISDHKILIERTIKM